jgi:hypothetical protein
VFVAAGHRVHARGVAYASASLPSAERRRRIIDMSSGPIDVVLQVEAEPDADADEVAALALRLRDELHEVDGTDIRLARSGAPPAGAKSADAVEWGTLLVQIVSSGALTALITAASAWIARQRSGSIRVKIGDDELELSGASSDDQRRLVAEWLARRDARPAGDA